MAKYQLSKVTRAILEMLKCRAYGHAWVDRGWLAMIKGSVRGFDQELTCDRCTTIRKDFRARTTLKLISRIYTYPTDYPGTVKQAEALKIVIRSDTDNESRIMDTVTEVEQIPKKARKRSHA